MLLLSAGRNQARVPSHCGQSETRCRPAQRCRAETDSCEPGIGGGSITNQHLAIGQEMMAERDRLAGLRWVKPGMTSAACSSARVSSADSARRCAEWPYPSNVARKAEWSLPDHCVTVRYAASARSPISSDRRCSTCI
jgi:hypothetical protein